MLVLSAPRFIPRDNKGLAYAALTELRGRLTGWYPYPFLDASHLGYLLVLVNAAAFTVLFKLLGLAVAWVDHKVKVG